MFGCVGDGVRWWVWVRAFGGLDLGVVVVVALV